MPFRIGQGYDIHRLASGKTLKLGGVIISEEIGCIAHSDGDVLIHAIMDALLGAAALPDIGVHFPNNDKAWKDASSLKMLEIVKILIEKEGYKIGNIDSVVILEKPKIVSFIPAMKKILAQTLGLEENQIGIKATTNEKVGEIGKGEAISALATCLLYKIH